MRCPFVVRGHQAVSVTHTIAAHRCHAHPVGHPLAVGITTPWDIAVLRLMLLRSRSLIVRDRTRSRPKR